MKACFQHHMMFARHNAGAALSAKEVFKPAKECPTERPPRIFGGGEHGDR